MKTILILLDSLNRHFLKCYNPAAPAITPHIDRLARESVVFDNHFIGSAPCMPARRDIFTGRLNFLERCWGGIEPFDVTLPQTLRQAGVYTHIVTDHTHYLEIGGENYLDQFDTWDYHRGQETDKWVSRVRPPREPEHLGRWHSQYARNRTRFHCDGDYPTPQTFAAACRWVRENRGADDFFLMVEGFDPHEPFDCPEEYRMLYGGGADDPLFDWPHYGAVCESEEEIGVLRRNYCATLTMADKWLGRFLDTLEETGLADDCLLLFTTDHGHLLGEHGFTGKNFTHSYNELAHIPLFLRLPGGRGAGGRVGALTQNIDLMPTVLEHHGVGVPHPVRGASLLRALEDENAGPEAIIYGWHGQTVNVCDGRYTYFRAPNAENAPCYNYCAMPSTLWRYWGESAADRMEIGRFLPHTSYPVYRIPNDLMPFSGKGEQYWGETQLFDLETDYAQRHPLTDVAIEERMKEMLLERMAWADAPAEQYRRLELR